MLHLSAGSNGGAMIETAARNGRAGVFKFPIPLQKRQDCNFSYSGLKTSFRYSVEKLGESTANKQVVSDMCAAFQDAAFRHIRDRIGHAFRYTRYKKIPISSLVVVGGVASNEELRR